MAQPARAAIVYDFDGTLARGNIQEHTFIPRMGATKDVFWPEVKAAAKQHDSDEVSVYMWRMLALAQRANIAVTVEMLARHGKETPLFDGVDSWFDRINEYAASVGLELEHYVISSGIYEMIAGCSIFSKFKQVFASRFIFDENGAAVWPGVVINYTTKTQFLFRINKGIDNTWDNDRINRWQKMEDRPVPFSRMLFIGDGDTDIPSMKMVRHQGGYALGVFDPAEWHKKADHVHRLIAEDRVHFVAPADYSAGTQLDVTVRGVLGRIANGLPAR